MSPDPHTVETTRRELLGAGLAAGIAPGLAPPAPAARIKLGLIGCGGRGGWLAGLFTRDGGYQISAVADYFQDAADACGEAHGVPAARRFTGLDGYKRLLDAGVEAVALEAPPCFYPDHAEAAVAAGCHVYMAKPVATDVPGVKRIEAAAARATGRKQVYLVDYQIPTDPGNQEVLRRVRAGAIGRVAMLHSHYLTACFPDPPRGPNLEGVLRGLKWVNDNALGGGYHGNACIHSVDAAMWVAGAVPVACSGASAACRPERHADSHDVFSLTFEYPDGLIHQHHGKHLPDQSGAQDFCGCLVHGTAGYAIVSYAAKATVLTPQDAYREDVVNLYEAGAVRNIAEFRRCVTERDTSNPTVRRAVDSCLAVLLGREAGRRHRRLTLRELLRENRSLPIDLRGLRR
jgi:predicted dehydrogenase